MLHERNDIRWISFPAHEWHNAAGEKQYARFVEFRDRAAQHAPLLKLKEPAHEIVGVARYFIVLNSISFCEKHLIQRPHFSKFLHMALDITYKY